MAEKGVYGDGILYQADDNGNIPPTSTTMINSNGNGVIISINNLNAGGMLYLEVEGARGFQRYPEFSIDGSVLPANSAIQVAEAVPIGAVVRFTSAGITDPTFIAEVRQYGGF